MALSVRHGGKSEGKEGLCDPACAASALKAGNLTAHYALPPRGSLVYHALSRADQIRCKKRLA